ncbi:MAG TPA: hypothetical protein VL326_38420 [Kofleriaceae bacterium]|jgi:hypothetical protein|nr:hypothetical protein [Kofleriaceae bacterium]
MDAEVLERGDISVFFRPAVQSADALVIELGVQSFFFVLSSERGTHRRVRVGRKRMPNSGERLWARVERVGSLNRALGDLMEDEVYSTKTRGERYQPAARAIGQGCYAFVRHGDHIHLAYRIEQFEPDAPDEVRPTEAASHVVLFEKVPRGRATWTTVGEPTMLDEEGAELVLVGDEEEPERELGIEVLPPATAAG